MTVAVTEEAISGFSQLSLSPLLLQALERAEYSQPTPIQSAFIPEALTGRDVVGQAQTGTGKTAAFLLPLLNAWLEEQITSETQGLILAPTRELVVQVAEEARKLSPHQNCRAIPIYGGQRFRQQVNQINKGAPIIVGTPGRILDHLRRGTLSLARLRCVVLDEVDRMLDIGFRPDIERILRSCPEKRQTLLLSATLPPPVQRLVKRYVVNPHEVNLSPKEITVNLIQQSYFPVDEDRKFELLVRVLEREQPRQCIIFCERKRWTEDLYRRLRQILRRVAVMHGDLSQPMRNRIMQGFRDGKLVYLVATDVVGRGIDVKGISHVFNYDLPEDPENYVHRIGRTGRLGADGRAIAFVTPEQGKQLTAIESFINLQLGQDHLPGFQTVRKRERPPQANSRAKSSRRKYSNRL